MGKEFHWNSPEDKDLYMNLQGLINKAGGAWKSGKQAIYLLENASYFAQYWDDVKDDDPEALAAATRDARENANKFFGIKMEKDQCLFIVRGGVYFEGRNGRITAKNMRAVAYGFVCDGRGVVAKYRIHYNHWEGAHFPNRDRTELMWTRSENLPNVAAEERKVRAEEAKKRAEERAAADNAPDSAVLGRIEGIEGEVLNITTMHTEFGPQDKMMVKTTGGWRLWISVPKSIADVEIGYTIRLTATVTPGRDDPKFGIGSRPAKASILKRGDN